MHEYVENWLILVGYHTNIKQYSIISNVTFSALSRFTTSSKVEVIRVLCRRTIATLCVLLVVSRNKFYYSTTERGNYGAS